jgi:hypothetical protein
MSIDFDEWFDNLEIKPNYVIKTDLDILDRKPIKPSKLYQLLRKPSQHRVKKHIQKLVNSIKSSCVLYKFGDIVSKN